ncbi:MAG TPA: glycosyltransferase [Pseudonocardiaceae bacterium]
MTGMAGAPPLSVATIITRFSGGAGALALRGILALDRDRYRPTIITGEPGGLGERARRAGVEVLVEQALRAPVAPRHDLLALRRLTELLDHGGFDIVHTHCAKAGTLGRLAAARVGVPRVVHTYHGFPFHRFQSAARRMSYLAIERRMGRLTDLGLCVGAGVAAEAVRCGLLPADRVRTIGVVVDRGGPTRADLDAVARARHALGLRADALVVGAVGRLTYQKAPEDFVAALAILARIQPALPGLVGVWIGGGELAGRVARLAARTPEVPLVFAGERTDVMKLLPALNVFALPSRYEGLPTAVVEAMVAGVPVVATDVNAVTDVVRPGHSGLLVPPQRPDLLAVAVRRLLDEPDLAARLAANASALVSDRYHTIELRNALDSAYTSNPPTRVRPGGQPGNRAEGPAHLGL